MDGSLIGTSAEAAAKDWLSDFEVALASGETRRIAALFAEECHWRDILAFTWNLQTTSGALQSPSAWFQPWNVWRRRGWRSPPAARHHGA